MQRNNYETYDSWFDISSTTQDGFFYTVGTKNSILSWDDNFPDRLFTQNIYLNEEGVKYIREVYNIFGVLGDLGGIVEVIMIIFGFFLFPISEHSFYLKAARLLYFARTKDQTMFKKGSNDDEDSDDKLEKYMNPEQINKNASSMKLKNEYQKHHIIRLSMCDNIRLFIANLLNDFCCNCCWRKKEKFQRLYEQSQEKINS